MLLFVSMVVNPGRGRDYRHFYYKRWNSPYAYRKFSIGDTVENYQLNKVAESDKLNT